MTTNLYVPLVNAHVELVSYNVIWLPAFPVDYFVCVFSVNPGKPQLLFIHLVLDFTTPCNYLFHKRHIIPLVKFNSGDVDGSGGGNRSGGNSCGNSGGNGNSVGNSN